MNLKDIQKIIIFIMLINLNNSDNNIMNIDNGLYFRKKDSFVDNQNIVISGMTNDENQTIKWEITKI
jgi:hypothetical protein